jgi:antitoxin MazE
MDMTISKWGNSLGVRIPGAVAKAAGIGLGTPVHITAIKGRIVLEPVRYDLKNLLSAITQKNRHPVIDTGSTTGSEAW